MLGNSVAVATPGLVLLKLQGGSWRWSKISAAIQLGKLGTCQCNVLSCCVMHLWSSTMDYCTGCTSACNIRRCGIPYFSDTATSFSGTSRRQDLRVPLGNILWKWLPLMGTLVSQKVAIKAIHMYMIIYNNNDTHTHTSIYIYIIYIYIILKLISRYVSCMMFPRLCKALNGRWFKMDGRLDMIMIHSQPLNDQR